MLHVAQVERQLIERRLDLLQADDVGFFSVEPVDELSLPGTNAVDVPGGNFHLRFDRFDAFDR